MEDGNKCQINLKYKVQNIGKGPATDVVFPQQAKLTEEMIQKGNSLKGAKFPSVIGLAPGESKTLNINQILEPNDVTVEEYLKGYKDGETYFGFDFQVIYRSEISKDEIYSTKLFYKIYVDKAIMESNKYLKINDPSEVKYYNYMIDKFSGK